MFTSIKNSKKGFTLIELLVVIAIIGILSSVVLASLSTARQKSRDAKRISDLGQIQLALELFFDAAQSYPSTTPGVASTVTMEGGVILLTNRNFLPQTPVPPAGGSSKYYYRGVTSTDVECAALGVNNTTACTSYILAVNLERDDNTVLGTDADRLLATGWAVHDADEVMAANVAGGLIFGNSDTCAVTVGTLAEKCYDIKP